MPRTTLTVQTCDRLTGLTPTYTSFDGTNGMELANAQGDVKLIVKNGDASAKTLTVVTAQPIDTDLAIADRTYTVPTTGSAELHVHNFTPSIYNATGSLLQLDIDDDTSVTIAAIRYI